MAIDTSLISKYLHDAYNTITEADYYKKHVEFKNNPNDTASSEATIVCATCPVWSKFWQYESDLRNGTKRLPILPLGAVMNFSLQEVLNNIPTPEIGSKIKRTVFGKANYSVQISRLLTEHSNISRSLYHWLWALDLLQNLTFSPGGYKGGRILGGSDTNSNHFIGLESDIFNYQFGLIFAFYTAGGKLISTAFAEGNSIVSTGSSLEAAGGFVVDGLNIMTSGVYTGILSNNQSGGDTPFVQGNGFVDQVPNTSNNFDPFYPKV